jgi:hypothetical protein
VPCAIYIHFFEWIIYPYIGEASGSQAVPDPLRVMGRLSEKEWLMGTSIGMFIAEAVSLCFRVESDIM